MPGILDAPMSEIYYMVNFWKAGLNLSPKELAEIGRSLTGKTGVADLRYESLKMQFLKH